MSCNAAAASCPGKRIHEINIEVGKPRRMQLLGRAARLSGASGCGPERRSCRSSKLCAPRDTRLMPAARYSAKRPRSMVPGIRLERHFRVGGECRARGAPRRAPARCASAENRLGVPPPRNTLTMRRAGRDRAHCNARSRSRASRYCASGSSPRSACELKSQYGHLRTHHGKCM